HNAVHMLCSHGSQRERLIDAVRELGYVKTDGLPESLRSEFDSFMAQMRVKTGSEGAFAATINSFNDSQCQHAVHEIVSFYGSICRHMEPH
ncbi:TPA: hypothetical protein ACGGE8_002479, partial [Vibrio cholerae]